MALHDLFAKYPELRFLNKHDWIGPWSMGVACLLIGGWSGLIVGFFASTVVIWHVTFSVNSAAHVFGRRAYATDEDAFSSLGGVDPRANIFDLGEDPLAYYKRRFTLARELWERTQKRELKSDENLAVYRRNLMRGLNQMAIPAATPIAHRSASDICETAPLPTAGEYILANHCRIRLRCRCSETPGSKP